MICEYFVYRLGLHFEVMADRSELTNVIDSRVTLFLYLIANNIFLKYF
jgi:hypothetical protein